jgi:hypothetical protein
MNSAIDKDAIVVPVILESGAVAFLPLACEQTPTFLVVVHPDKAHLLTTPDPNGDRIMVGAVTIADAIGQVLMDNPGLSYRDVLDHMEV